MKKSKLEEYSDKVLYKICEQVLKNWDETDSFNSEFTEACDEILKFYGIQADYIDYDFLYNIIILNKFGENKIENFKRPKVREFTYDWNVDERQYVSKSYRHEIETYMVNEKEIFDVIRVMTDEGHIDYYDGREVNYDVYDSDITDLTLDKSSLEEVRRVR